MFYALYQFFVNVLFNVNNSGIPTSSQFYGFITSNVTINGYSMQTVVYLSSILALICTIIIFVLCCLFVYKIIKLIGGLIYR